MKFPAVATLLLSLWLSPAAAVAQVEVERKAPAVTTKTFNPARPPKEMPPLRPGEAAVCESKFLCQVQVEVEITTVEGEKPQCKIAAVKSELRLDIVVWLPTDASAKIRAHEDGHREISERFYANAEEVARRISEQYMGRSLEIKSPEPADTRPVIQRVANEFCQKYLGQVEVPSERVQMRYDQLTDHGRNRLGEKEAIRRAMEVAATRPAAPSPARPRG